MVIGGCAQNEQAKDFYQQAEQGSTWELAFNQGTLVNAVYGTDYYMGACPVLTQRTVHLPDDSAATCDPGCACAFKFFLEDVGDVTDDYIVSSGYRQQCGEAILDCHMPSPGTGEAGFCTWTAGTIDPSVDPFGDCSYVFVQSQIN